MILQYFKIKENKYKEKADSIYIEILKQSKLLVNKNYFFEKNFNISFEIITILLVFYLKLLNYEKSITSKSVKSELIKNFISDLDKSIRDTGVGDMSIGKYVKKYVRKFYYRLKILDLIFASKDNLQFSEYIARLNKVQNSKIKMLINDFNAIFRKIKKNMDIY